MSSLDKFKFYFFLVPVCLVLGLMCVIMPWFITMSFVILVCVLIVSWIYPDFALFTFLLLAYGIIPHQLVPAISQVFGGLSLNDMALLGLIPLVFIRLGGNVRLVSSAFSAYVSPFLLLLFLVVVSVINAKFVTGVDVKNILQELRPLVYWMLFPISMMIFFDENAMRRFLRLLMLLCVTVSIMLIFQSFTGKRILGLGLFSDVYTVNSSFKGVTRSTNPAIYLVIFELCVFYVTYLYGQKVEFIRKALLPLFVLALLVTFGRGIWFSCVIVMFIIGFFVNKKRLVSSLLVAAVAGVVVVASLAVLKPAMIEAMFFRFSSVGEEIEKGSSIGRRIDETNYAFSSIKHRPVLGLGLGAQYKPYEGIKDFPGEERYMHNSYLYLVTKMGILSLLFPILVIIKFYSRAKSIFSSASIGYSNKIVAYSCFGVAMIPMFLASFTQPEWMTYTGITFFSLMMAFVEVVRAKSTGMSADIKNYG